jgi:hypothetical protein
VNDDEEEDDDDDEEDELELDELEPYAPDEPELLDEVVVVDADEVVVAGAEVFELPPQQRRMRGCASSELPLSRRHAELTAGAGRWATAGGLAARR